MKSGRGSSPAHHGEILQGVFEDSGGRLVHALATLPWAGRGSRALFEPGSGPLAVEPGDRVKAGRAALLAVRRFGRGARGGRLSISGDVPVGWGMGSSTCDVAAGVRAVAAAFGEEIAPEEVARLAVEAEGASDPVMFDGRAVLFAHREGRVVEDFGGGLPPMAVVGVRCGPEVETLALPEPRYTRREMEAFAELRGLLRRAVRERDARLVGKVATASARINSLRHPKPGFERTTGVASRTGAAGVAVAHSGCVAGLLFDFGDPGIEERVEDARRLFARLRMETWRFDVGGDPPGAWPEGVEALEKGNTTHAESG